MIHAPARLETPLDVYEETKRVFQLHGSIPAAAAFVAARIGARIVMQRAGDSIFAAFLGKRVDDGLIKPNNTMSGPLFKEGA